MFKKGNIIRDSAEFLDEHLMGNVNVILRATSNEGCYCDGILVDVEDFSYNLTNKEDRAIYDRKYSYYGDINPVTDEEFCNHIKKCYWTNVEGSLKTPQNLKDIERVSTYLDSINYVTSTISIIDIVKQLHKTIMDEDQKYYTIPDSMQQINNLFFLYEMNEESDLSSLINYDADEGIIIALMKTFSTIEVPGIVDDIDKFIDENIYSSNDNLKFELTGMMIFIVDFMWLVVKSSAISIGLSLLVIFCISTLFFRSWRYGIMSVIPLLGAITLNFGLMGWFGIELTHLTAILSSIILGVGVDFTIHYITEYQRIKKEKGLSEISEETIDNVG